MFPIRLSNPVTKECLEEAYSNGMIKKSDLEDGEIYFGSCRNASEAKWNSKKEVFVYLREKFGTVFPEDINHPEDDDGFDLFIPLEKK